MHPDQLTVPVDVVRELVAGQFPAWASLPVTELTSQGTVNALFRIGERLVARLPLRPGDVESTRHLLEAEADAARELFGRTRVATPWPVALGEPGAGYPLPWSVQTWLPGTVASQADPSASIEFARDLAKFIADVRALDTRGRTFSGTGRGGDLHSHDEWMQVCFEHSAGLLDVPRLRRTWAMLRELPRTRPQDVMTHGDLIPGNVLVCAGRLVGVIDVGGLGPADQSLDLVAGWHLLADAPRQHLRDHLGCGDVEWERGKAWAFAQAMGLVWYYADSNPVMSLTGRRTLERIVAATD